MDEKNQTLQERAELAWKDCETTFHVSVDRDSFVSEYVATAEGKPHMDGGVSWEDLSRDAGYGYAQVQVVLDPSRDDLRLVYAMALSMTTQSLRGIDKGTDKQGEQDADAVEIEWLDIEEEGGNGQGI